MSDFKFKDGTEVTTTLNGIGEVKCKVIGKSSTDITQSYILECVGSELPNETYPYKAFVMPQSLIKPFQEEVVHDYTVISFISCDC